MAYYPIFIDIKDKPCLVVGGGDVGSRKALSLLDCGARVTVVSPWFTDRLSSLSPREKVAVLKRAYREPDLDGMFLVIGATDDETVNRRISEDARHRGILCNIVDRPELCEFILPSVVKRGELIIAISTSGKSPAFAKRIREELEKQFGEEYTEFLRLMGAVRKRLLGTEHAPETHKHLFNRLIDEGLLKKVRQGDKEGINGMLRRVLGEGFDVDGLLDPSAEESS